MKQISSAHVLTTILLRRPERDIQLFGIRELASLLTDRMVYSLSSIPQ